MIAANGERHEVDVIIWGTGFEVSHPPIGKRVHNEKGECLAELWKDSSPEAYLGTNIENVPNAFLMLGQMSWFMTHSLVLLKPNCNIL